MQNQQFQASSDAEKTPPVAQLPADSGIPSSRKQGVIVTPELAAGGAI